MTKTPISLTNNRYRLGYHVMAPTGWINDPNGFCYFKGYYHIFYQHHPYSADWGPMHWGHARSKDLVHWETLPVALAPDSLEDEDGCFSGSAIVKDDTMYLFYTGHHYYGDNDPDHFWQNQNMAYSTDGVNFTKYEHNPIIAKEPEDNTHHFRDPKVWQHNDTYYMILGSQEQDGLGRTIIYTSKNLTDWSYAGPMAKASDLALEGFMWECPDFFPLNGKDFLLLSPQGIEAQEQQYLNLFQTGYFVGEMDYETTTFTHGDFHELDNGHDFYATQTTLTPDGRRIVFGWMSMWESEMPEKADGWAGALTLPRELVVENNSLYMKPVKELEGLRVDAGETMTITTTQEAQVLVKQADSTELLLTIPTQAADFSLALTGEDQSTILTLTYTHENRMFIVKRNDKADVRYGTIKEGEAIHIQLFVDKSSAEFFINDGETVFTERFYADSQPMITFSAEKALNVEAIHYSLKNDVITY